MDPIDLEFRVGRLPAAAPAVGGELSAEELDANFSNLRTACEQLDAEKIGVDAAAPLPDVPLPLVASDETVIFRGGVGYKAPLSALKTFVLAASAPAALTAGQWTATVGVGSIELNITALPDNGGSALTSLEYRLNAGTPVTLSGGATTGIRTITGLTGGVAQDVQVRAVNAVGAGAWSDIKTRTPTSSTSFSAAYVTHAVNGTEFQNPKSFTGLSVGAADATRKLYVFFYVRFPNTTDTVTLSINGGGAISPIASGRFNSARQVFLFEANLATGTTADFSFSSSGSDFNNAGIAIVRAVGSHTALSATSDSGASISTSINTSAGDTIFLGAMYQFDGGSGFFTVPSGFTEHFDEPTRPSIPAQPATLRSGTAAGGTPETFTSTAGGASGVTEVALRLRAS